MVFSTIKFKKFINYTKMFMHSEENNYFISRFPKIINYLTNEINRKEYKRI